MNLLNDGALTVAPSEYLRTTQARITSALTELLDVGARVRPLLVENQRVGWVRGVFPSERRMLKLWIEDEIEYIEHLLLLGTSLALEEIWALSPPELRSLARVVREMTASDARLYGYLPAYVTTAESEQLWAAKGPKLSSFDTRSVTLPDERQVRLRCPSDHALLWALLSDFRVTTKSWQAAAENTLMLARAFVGKGADAAINDHKRRAKSLQTNTLDPWRESIRYRQERDFEDGWAHAEDNSVEGMQREIRGMIEEDKHERLMAAFERQQRERLEVERKAAESKTSARLEALLDQPSFIVLTEEQVRAMLAQSPRPVYPSVSEAQSSLADRLAKYV